MIEAKIQWLQKRSKEAHEHDEAAVNFTNEESEREYATREVLRDMADKQKAAEQAAALEKEKAYIDAEGITEEEREALAKMRRDRKAKQ